MTTLALDSTEEVPDCPGACSQGSGGPAWMLLPEALSTNLAGPWGRSSAPVIREGNTRGLRTSWELPKSTFPCGKA